VQLVPNPVQLLWDPDEAVRTYSQLQQVKRSMMRWSEPTRVKAICSSYVIFIFNSCHMKAKCVFPVNFCSFSEIILPWCLVISTKSPFSFPHIPLLKPKVSRTCILSPSILHSQLHTNPKPCCSKHSGYWNDLSPDTKESKSISQSFTIKATFYQPFPLQQIPPSFLELFEPPPAKHQNAFVNFPILYN